MKLTIFDLDETLISADSDHAWGDWVAERGLVDAEQHQAENQRFYEDYKQGRLDIDEYLKFSVSVLTKYPLKTLHEERAQFIDTRIKPMILSKGVELIARHKADGDHVMIVTATIDFVTRPIADLLGIDDLIAPNPELTNDGYSGEIVGVPSFGAGKVTRLNAWLEQTGHSLKGSTFYSDSHNDLPLLELVDNPVPVDPDPKLESVAKTRGWTCISLR